MNLNEEVEVLKGVPLFAKIEPAKLKLIAFTSERMTYGSGQEVCHQGDPGDAMYVILGGVADVLIDTDKGQIRVAKLKGPIFEVGLGNGRTYDHLRDLFPGRDIYVFERRVAAHPDCIPPDDRLFLGDADKTIPVAAKKLGAVAALIHTDLGTGDHA